MKIIYVITGLNYGGAEKLLLDTCRELKRRSVQILIIYLTTDGNLAPQFEQESILVKKVDFENSNHLKAIYQLCKIVRKFAPDIIHTHLPMANFYGILGAKLCGVSKVICTLHNVDKFLLSKSLFNKVYKFAFKSLINNSSRIHCIAVSDSVKDHYAKYCGLVSDKMHIVYNAVDFSMVREKAEEEVDDLPFIDKKDFVILNIGRLVKEKGQIYLLQAVNELVNKRNHKNIKCIIIGEGKGKEFLGEYIESNNLSSNIYLLGVRANPYKYIKLSSIFVMPSLFEGFSIALIEAFALKKIIIGTDISGINKIILNNETGLLIKPKEYLELADRIEEIYEGNAFILDLPKNMEKINKKLNIEEYVDVLQKYYYEEVD
jgi:glycosyltransferase involved in cell wall biosynthesis